jgi:hypothetical protein
MPSTILSIAALVISIVSAYVLLFLGIRQLRLMRQDNHLPALMTLFGELRSWQFHKNYLVITSLDEKKYPPELGIFGLPEAIQVAALDVAYFYQMFANLVKMGILDEEPVLAAIRMRLIHTWKSLEPYAETERKKFSGSTPQQMWSVLQEFAERAQEKDLTAAQYRVGEYRRGWSHRHQARRRI